MGNNTTNLNEQLEAWKVEQISIASQVTFLENDMSSNCMTTNDDERFEAHKSVKDDTNLLYYGGVDVSFPENEEDQAVATYVILDPVQEKIVYRDYLYFDLKIPYVSSFLSFREIEPFEFLVKKQRKEKAELTPAAILVDGNGVLHRRRAGIACFLGVRTGVPTIGVGKSLYCEGGLRKELVNAGIDRMLLELQDALSEKATSSFAELTKSQYVLMNTTAISPKHFTESPIETTNNNDRNSIILNEIKSFCSGVGVYLEVDSGEVLGCALVGHGGRIGVKHRKQLGTKNPIFISIGHNISLQDAVIVCAELSKARIPEPIRHADLWGRELLRKVQHNP